VRLPDGRHVGLVGRPELVAHETSVLAETCLEVVDATGEEVTAGPAGKTWIDRVSPWALHAAAGPVPGAAGGVDGRRQVARVRHVPAIDLGSADSPRTRGVQRRRRAAHVDDVAVDGPAGGGAVAKDPSVLPNIPRHRRGRAPLDRQ